MTGPLGPRVVVAASPQIFKKGARLAPQVVSKGCVRFAQGATAPAALRVADCPTGNAYKISVTGLAVCVICDTISSATYFLVSP